MRVNVKLFATLRDMIDPKPPLGEPIAVEIEENETIGQVLEKIGIPRDSVAIIFISGNHQSIDTPLTEDGTTISVFPPVVGG